MYEGTYTDGRSAVRRRVHVTITMNRLHITDEAGGLVDEWSFPGLRLVGDRYRRRQPVRLSHLEKGEARLLIHTRGILEQLAGRAPGIPQIQTWGRRVLVQVGIALAALGILLLVLLAALPYAADRLSTYFPRQWAYAIGADFIRAFRKEFPECRGEAGHAALSTLAGRLVRASDENDRVRIYVFKSPLNNAFAIPGGHIGIFEGLFKFTESPEELAGVLAHELAHIHHRHPTKSILRQLGYRLIFSAMTGDASVLGASAAKLTETLLNLSFTREAELEADRTSIHMLKEAGIRSDGLSRFLDRLEKTAPPSTSRGGYFSTHPAPRERTEQLRGQIGKGSPAMTSSDWESVQRMCEVADF